jgi:hypothetical protein
LFSLHNESIYVQAKFMNKHTIIYILSLSLFYLHDNTMRDWIREDQDFNYQPWYNEYDYNIVSTIYIYLEGNTVEWKIKLIVCLPYRK